MKQALEYGLVDSIAEKANTLEEVAALKIERQSSEKSEVEEIKFEDFDGVISDSIFENAIYKKYEKSLRRKASLALEKAMQLIEEGADIPLANAMMLEMDGLHEAFSIKDAYAGLSGIINRKPANLVGE